MTHTPREDDRVSIPPEEGLSANYSSAEQIPAGDPFGGTVAPATSGVPADDWPTAYSTTPSSGTASTADVAKDEASTMKDTAVDAGKNVAATAKDEAANVVADTKAQAKSLLGSMTSEVSGQARTQQQKIAASLHSLSGELTGMASGSEQSGPLTDLAHQAAQKGSEIAQWLEDREPSDVVREVKSFARRKPVTFLALCALAGVVAGRVTRGAVAANTSIDSPSSDGAGAPRAVETRQSASLVEEVPATPTYDDRPTTDPSYDASSDFGYQGDRSSGMR